MIRYGSNIIRHNNIYFNIFWQRSIIISFLLSNPLLIFFNFYFLLRRKKLWLRFWLPSFNWKLKPVHTLSRTSHYLKITYMFKLIRLFSTISLLMFSYYCDFYKLFWNARYYLPGLIGKFNFKLFYVNNTSILQIFHFNSKAHKDNFINFFSNRIYWITFFRRKHFSIHYFLQKFLFINFCNQSQFSFFKEWAGVTTQLWSFGNFSTVAFDEKSIQTSPTLVSNNIFSIYYSNRLFTQLYFYSTQALLTTIYTFVIHILLLFTYF